MRLAINNPDLNEEQALQLAGLRYEKVAVDLETVSLENKIILGIAIAVSEHTGFYFFNSRDILAKSLIEKSPLVLFHNASFDVPAIEAMDIKMQRWEDTMMLAYSAGLLSNNLETLSRELLAKPYTSVTSQWKDSKQGNIGIDHKKMALWSIQHAMNTYKLWDTLPKTKLYRDIDRPCIELVIEMHKWGLKVDQYKLTLVEQETMEKVWKLEDEIHEELGELNLASNPQIVTALQKKGILGTRKTKAGKDSVSDESLAPLHNPITDKILKWRSLMKTISTYVPAFRSVDGQGKIHTEYGYTNTGRWNSSNPNLQNMTRDEKFAD